ncbi:dimethylarginine dimethylaminohydrolase family protein [Edaphobacter flagellatus]|uniref:dimethylarginine dimethylaminohydrolase family protein n=1 Tax=Edaphobacter flagellatus TaxID=1933044 RepID=UPI0021B16952|nr:arginine deiminase-related protein [Edaphobacter flagellatus]
MSSISIAPISSSSSTFSSLPHFDRPTYLMCPPEWYDVNYVINPWMAGNLHRPSRDKAFAQWKELHSQLQRLADIRLIHAKPGSPDMVFVGHTALVQHGVAALSSFTHPQRQTEEEHLRKWFQAAGFLVWDTPRETAFEGEGDALFDPTGERLWAAHGVRTCLQSHRHVADAWHTPVTSLHLVDPRFYHLDTCFAPLSGGHLLYFPVAFDAPSRAKIEAAYAPEKRIAVSEQEATHFACNVINVGNNILMGITGTTLAKRLEDLGYKVTELDLSEFIRGGGSAKALALRLSDSRVSSGLPAQI